MNSAAPKSEAAYDSGEETLRLIAKLPAPDGLVDRVQEGIRHAPPAGRVLAWKRPVWMHSSFVRSAAAAAIVCVVVGSGWRIYSHVQPSATGKILQMPVAAQPSASFGIGGARRVPDTLDRPVLSHVPAAHAQDPAPVTAAPAAKGPHQARKAAKKSTAKVAALSAR